MTYVCHIYIYLIADILINALLISSHRTVISILASVLPHLFSQLFPFESEALKL